MGNQAGATLKVRQRLAGGFAMDNFHLMISLLVAGVLLLGIGFTFREKEWGVWMTGAGGLSMLAPIALGIYIGLN